MQPDRVKHLEMLQAVIARLGSNSFLVKGWAVTATGVFLGFSVSNDEPWLALPSAFVIAMFWAVDVYYLRAERLFRVLYDRARDVNADSYEPFAMNATSKEFVSALGSDQRGRVTRRSVAFSGTIVWLYLALIVAAGGVAWVTATQIDNSPASESRPDQGGGAGQRR